MSSLAEKVREALSVPDMSYLKQDSFDKSEVCAILFLTFPMQTSIYNIFQSKQSTGNDISQNSRANSPRRLTKQTALESPTNDTQTEGGNMLKPVSHYEKSQGHHVASVKKEETAAMQRQRIRKAGPFAVDSQSIPDSRVKYAGSWPPPVYEDHDQHCNNHSSTTGQKPV